MQNPYFSTILNLFGIHSLYKGLIIFSHFPGSHHKRCGFMLLCLRNSNFILRRYYFDLAFTSFITYSGFTRRQYFQNCEVHRSLSCTLLAIDYLSNT